MPYRRYGKYRTRNYRKRRFTRSSAASSIARAWRAKKRRKAGLYERTVLSNRRAVKVLKKSVETKMCDDNQATQALQFAGQFNDAILVDNTGQEVGAQIPFAGDLLYMQQGTENNRRVGAWIQLKSMTMHYCITIPQNRPCDLLWYQIFVVLDRSPLLGASLTGATGVLAGPAGVVAPPNNKLALAFQNLSETGKEGRFKILARKRHKMSNFLTSTTNSVGAATSVPAITQAAQGSIMRPLYYHDMVQQTSKPYPKSVIGSINLKLNHKINYGPNVSVQPSNQTIRIFAFQCAPTGDNQPRAVLQYYTRVRYKDA